MPTIHQIWEYDGLIVLFGAVIPALIAVLYIMIQTIRGKHVWTIFD